ncbi:hypothetical protein DEO72_LG5g2556 [Vigna unguiculata]|uniref:Uncharacterized protein n=1 Tax=Vigna unguiculata TaxID=3917 RepID=A0A4D6M030_VIGUN|nr:hypothetical protein DEO72_LG5g2556 [Vigna unguiculata]
MPYALSARHPRAVCASSALFSSHAIRTVSELSTRPPCTVSRTIPSIVHLLTLPFIPDSPRWLLSCF